MMISKLWENVVTMKIFFEYLFYILFPIYVCVYTHINILFIEYIQGKVYNQSDKFGTSLYFTQLALFQTYVT